jgi:predicted nucleotidyltransferase
LDNPAEIDPPDYARDRDVFHDKEGRVYVALGHIQPRNRYLSFLKYIPDRLGRWKVGDTKYRRLFFGGSESAVQGMRFVPPEYLRKDTHFRTTLLEVPRRDVTKYFSPEKRLREIIDNGPADKLESDAMKLAESLNKTLGISLDNLGVAGSILWKAQSSSWSDVNMNIYGLEASWKLEKGYFDMARNNEHIEIRQINEWAIAMTRMFSKIPTLTPADVRLLFARRKVLKCYDRPIGITPVLLPDECPIRHGSESYHPISSMPIRVVVDIKDDTYGLFSPALYITESEPVPLIKNETVNRLMIYEGSFGGLLRTGDKVEVSGVIQHVKPRMRGDKSFYQVMVGNKDFGRKEYAKIIKASL